MPMRLPSFLCQIPFSSYSITGTPELCLLTTINKSQEYAVVRAQKCTALRNWITKQLIKLMI